MPTGFLYRLQFNRRLGNLVPGVTAYVLHFGLPAPARLVFFWGKKVFFYITLLFAFAWSELNFNLMILEKASVIHNVI